MATLVISTTDSNGRTRSATLNYSVSSTNDRTTVNVTSVVCKSSIELIGFPVSVACDGTTLYSGSVDFTPSGRTYAINKSKAFARGTSATSKVLTLNALSTSKNASVSVPALPTYPVTFDAAGGTGAPSPQSKHHGIALSLGVARPVRSGFQFVGWARAESPSAVAFQPGASYTENAALSLVAVWAVAEPTLSITRSWRSDATGAPADEGAHAAVAVSYAVSPETTVSTFICAVNDVVAAPVAVGDGTATFVVDAAMGTDQQYDVLVVLTDSAGTENRDDTVMRTDVITTAFFTMDMLAGGHGMALGGPSKRDGLMVYMEPFIVQAFAGIIQMFAGVDPPEGWLPCDGRAVSRTDYAILFSRIGTTWGAGDGTTTFNLPDLRGRGPIGAGAGSGLTSRTLGGNGGSEHIQSHTHGFTNPKMPNHVHTMAHTHPTTSEGRAVGYNYGSGSGQISTGVTKVRVAAASSGTNYVPRVSNADVNYSGYHSTGASSAANTGNPTSLPATTNGAVGAVSGATTGSSGNMQPFAVVAFIICTGSYTTS